MPVKLTVGSEAPDFEYTRLDGARAEFSALWGGGPALVIWPRHAG